jgi:elongation factor Ts
MSDIEKVKKLRELTGAGFKDCNLAIKESDGRYRQGYRNSES